MGKLQCVIDQLATYVLVRWVIAFLLLSVFVYRAAINQGKRCRVKRVGFHVISYFLGLYMLDKFLGFISPKDEDDVTILPTREGEEFKPFRRAIKELDLWYS